MSSFAQYAWSSIGRKILMAVTGLGLFLFVIVHLTGNLTLLIGSEAFNAYSHFLVTLFHGWFVLIADAGLVLFFLVHAVSGIRVYRSRKAGRGDPYAVSGNAGGASKKTLASMSMMISGVLILAFVVYHVWHFKFGPGEAAGYTTVVHGEEMRDLYRLVVEEFNKPVIAVGYMIIMVMLGAHLYHGVWSAFQSLGILNSGYMPLVRGLGIAFAILLGVGFFYIPLHILLFVDPAAAGEAATHL